LKDNRKPDLEREEDHRVKATIILDDNEITDVPCKIFLPERIQEKPYLILKPPREVANRIMASHRGALHATVHGLDKEKQLTIDAPEVYFSGSSTKYWGDGISDSTIPGEPQDLHIIHHLRDNDYVQRTQIVFWISPNQFLTPLTSSSSSYTGELKHECVRKVEFLIKKEVRLVFEKHFRSKTIENGDFVQWAFLAACVDLDFSADDVSTIKKNVLPDIDDFLLIASFAARRRTACLGWTASDKNAYAMFYRGNYVFPDFDRDESLNNGLIDIKDFERFMQTCYPAFLGFENKLAIRNALYSAVPPQPRTIETTFLHVFAGLETLILDFKRRKDLEFVIPPNDWSSFRKYLHKCIKNSTEPNLETEQRASMYRKLDELNRVSLREAYELFCKEYFIDLVDLWPIFGESDLVGLVDIRNKLIHGDPFPHAMFDPLVVAKEHLIYILERVLTRILKWNVAETKINPDYLRSQMLVIKDMPSERKKLSEHINDAMYSIAELKEELH
jgi:hypothetical protein